MKPLRELGFSMEERAKILQEFCCLKEAYNIRIKDLAKETKLSKRTIVRILKGVKNLRLDTIKILKEFIEKYNNNIPSFPSFDDGLHALIMQQMKIGTIANSRKSEKYSGVYKCYRMTVYSEEVVVTGLRIWVDSDSVPRFTHVEKVPDETNVFGDSPDRMLQHEGYVFFKERRAHFISVGGSNVRSLIAVGSSNEGSFHLSGILLSVDAIRKIPFAAKVLIRRVSKDLDVEAITSDLGVLPPSDAEVKDIVSYLNNSCPDHGVLRPKELD